MAKSKSSTHKTAIYSKIKDPVKPKWMRVVRFITLTLLFIFVLIIIAGIMVDYYRIISKH